MFCLWEIETESGSSSEPLSVFSFIYLCARSAHDSGAVAGRSGTRGDITGT